MWDGCMGNDCFGRDIIFGALMLYGVAIFGAICMWRDKNSWLNRGN